MKHLLLGAVAPVILLLAACNPATATTDTAQNESTTNAVRTERLLPLEGVQNARDIGGYRTTDGRTVKWDVIYRTAALSGLTDKDRAYLEEHNLRYIHDLRTVEERETQPTQWSGAKAPQIRATDYSMDTSAFANLFANGTPTVERAREVFAQSYPEILKIQVPQQRALFADLLRGDGAVLYHCSAGKDRTGMATALILAVLGVPRETILEDYELSNLYYKGHASAAGAENNPQFQAFMQMPEEVRAVFMGVDARYLQAVFDVIDRDYGSIENYVERELGVDAQAISRLKLLYTE